MSLPTARMFIDGNWCNTKTTTTTLNPSSGEPLGAVCCASREDVDRAVDAARGALPRWKTLGLAGRAKIIAKAADGLVDRYGKQGQMTPLKQLIIDEVGKRLPEADIEVIESSDMLRYFAQRGPEVLADVEPTLDQKLWPTKRSIICNEPRGVVGVIKAWNYPLEIPLWAIGPALVAGNTVVFKPSEHSSFVGAAVIELFQEAGLPAGVLNLILGGSETGASLAAHPRIDAIAFTGSQATGMAIGERAGALIRHASLELGGNDPAFVCADADLELAANGLVWGAYCNSGQVCVGVKRCFVHTDVFDRLLPLVVERTQRLRYGVDYGPLISDDQVARVAAFVADALDKGATIAATAQPPATSTGFFSAPTVLTHVPPSARLMTEECFGPLLPMIRVRSIEEAVNAAEGTSYGLGASIWTQSQSNGLELAGRLRTGMVWVNDVNVAFPQAPWGGVKQSGLGTDLSDEGFREYVVPKHICLEKGSERTRAWWYPYPT